MDEAETRLLGGRLILLQPQRGHRAGTDAVLLAAAVGVEAGMRVADIGSGVGTAGLAVALRAPGTTVALVEREHDLAQLARRNAGLNGCDARCEVIEADVLEDRGPVATVADVVMSNPPFFAAGAVRLPSDGLKARAYGLGGRTHGDWLRAMLRWARPKARVIVVHRPDTLPALVAAAEGRLGGLRLRPILARAEQPAIRILLGGTVGSRGPMVVLPPLVLHGAERGFTPEAEALHRGEATASLWEEPKKKRPAKPAGPSHR